MKNPIVIGAALIVGVIFLSSIASAETMEQNAARSGKLEARYNRIRFLCLLHGISFPTLEENAPGFAKLFVKMKANYPDFYAVGAADGSAQADSTYPDITQRECDAEVKRMRDSDRSSQ
jgi:hypothetical protein